MLVLFFILMVSFLEKWIEVDCGEGRRPLSQVAESRWILLANIFSVHGAPIGAESVRLQVIALPQTRKPGSSPGFLFLTCLRRHALAELVQARTTPRIFREGFPRKSPQKIVGDF
jgi:hypothetical protein